MRNKTEQGKKVTTQNLFIKEVDRVEQSIWKGFFFVKYRSNSILLILQTSHCINYKLFYGKEHAFRICLLKRLRQTVSCTALRENQL